MTNQAQILSGTSLGRGEESLYKWSRSHDQDGRPYMVKILKNLLLQNQKSYDLETWHVLLGTQVLQVYINDDPGLTLTYFTARSKWVICTFEWGKLL